MYTLTKADVLLIAGELAALDDARWGEIIALTKSRVSNTDAWGGDVKAQEAATYLAAHLGKLALQAQVTRGVANSAGQVLEVKVGPVSKSFASLQDMMGDKEAVAAGLALTRYGVLFRGLQRTFSFVRGFVA
jgi:hypothetical protein